MIDRRSQAREALERLNRSAEVLGHDVAQLE